MATDIVQAIMVIPKDHFEIAILPELRSMHTMDTRPKTIMYSIFRDARRQTLYKWVRPIVEVSIFPYQLANAQQPVNPLMQLQNAPKITTRHTGLIPEILKAEGFYNIDKSANEDIQHYRMLLS